MSHMSVMVLLLCKLDMSHVEGDWKGLSTVKPPSALRIRNMLVHQVPEKPVLETGSQWKVEGSR